MKDVGSDDLTGSGFESDNMELGWPGVLAASGVGVKAGATAEVGAGGWDWKVNEGATAEGGTFNPVPVSAKLDGVKMEGSDGRMVGGAGLGSTFFR